MTMHLGLAGQPVAQNALFDLSAIRAPGQRTSSRPESGALTSTTVSQGLSARPVSDAAQAPKTDAFLAFDAASGGLTLKPRETLSIDDVIDFKKLAARESSRQRRRGKHTVYNLTVERHHTYIAGGYRVHNTSLFVPQGTLGTIGNAIGNQLALLFGVDDFAKSLVLNAAGSAVLSYFGDVVGGDVRFTGVGNASLHIGSRFAFNLAGSVGGYFGSRLGAKIGEALGLGEFGSGLFSAVGGYIGSTLATKAFAFVAGHAFNAIGGSLFSQAGAEALNFASGTSLSPFGFGTAIGSFIGAQAAYALLGDDFSPRGAQIGNAIGSLASTIVTGAIYSTATGFFGAASLAGTALGGTAVGNFLTAATAALGAGPVGIIVAAVLVFVGTLFGGLFGRKPKPWALTEIEFGRRQTEEAFYVGRTSSGDGGNTQLSGAMAGSAVEALNEIVGSIGGTILATADGAFSLGHRKSQNQVVANGQTYYFTNPEAAVDFGVKGVLNLTDIEGGDIYQKRALAILTSENAPDDIQIETTEELRQALGSAATFGVREDNQILTDAVFEELGFAARARFEEALRQAEDIGVEGAYGDFASDTFRRDDADGGYSRGVTRQEDTLSIRYSGGGGEGDSPRPSGFNNTTRNSAFEVTHRAEGGLDILDVSESITHGTIRVWRSGSSLVVQANGDTASTVGTAAGGEIRLIIKNWSLEDNGVYWEQFDRIRFADGTEFDLTSINAGSNWNGAARNLTATNTVLASAVRTPLGISAANNAFADSDLTARITNATRENGTIDGNAFKDNGAAATWDFQEISYQRKGSHSNSAQTITADAAEDLLIGGGGNDTYRIGLDSGADIIFDARTTYDVDTIHVDTAYQRGVSSTQTYTYGGGEDRYTQTVTTYSIQNGTTRGTSRQLVSEREVDAGTTDRVEFRGGIVAEDLVFQMSGDDLIIGIRQADDPWGDLGSLDNTVTIRDWRDENNRIEQIRFTSGSPTLTDEDITAQIIAQNGADGVFVIDLLADGLDTLSVAESNVLFDIDGDGFLERTAWLAGGDGFLALDRNHDGVINDASELFSAWAGSYGGAFVSLSTLDTNSDGKISIADAGFSDLRIWLDLNADGSTGIGELNALHRFGIESIDLSGEVGFGPTDDTAAIFGLQLGGADVVRKAEIDQLGLVGDAQGAGYGVIFDRSESGVTIGSTGLEFQAGSEVVALRSETPETGVTETVTEAASYTATVYDDNITVSLGSGQSAIVSGFGGADVLTGGNSNDVLVGGAGADKAYGGAGDDVIVVDGDDNLTLQRGGTGIDLLIAEREAAVGDAYGTLYNISTLGFEKFIGGAGDDGVRGGLNGVAFELSGGIGNDRLDGANLGDTLRGDSGDDTLRGYAGNDTVYGGTGEDTFVDGAGADSYDGGTGIDIVDYYGHNNPVTVNFATGTGSRANANGDTYRSVEHVIGTDGADTLIGSSSSETFAGRGGADSISGGEGTDTVDYSASATGVTVNLGSSAAQSRSEAAGDRLSGIENVIGSAGVDTLTGSGAANEITGGAGADSIKGMGGDDVLHGEDGHDSISGNAGNDTLIGGIGSDYLNGGGDNDTYVFGIDTGADTVVDTTGNTRLVFGENIHARDLLMTQSGNHLQIQVIGGNTFVTVNNYYTDPGRFVVVLGDGADVPVQLGDGHIRRWRGTNAANSRHLSQSSRTNDILIGQGGNDSLRAAGGDDIYIYNRGDGNDTILDFGTTTTTYGGGEDQTTVTTVTSGNDTLALGHNIDPADVRLQRSGNHLIVLIMPEGHKGADPANAVGRITITNQFLSSGYRIERISFADGEVWEWSREPEAGVFVNDILANMGTDLNETFAMPTNQVAQTRYGGGEDNTPYTVMVDVESDDPVFRDGRGGNDTIHGGKGDDQLLGSAGVDRLYGRDGNDVIVGGKNSDYAYGGAGNDTYIVADGDGFLQISDSDGYDRVVFGEGITPDMVGALREGRHLRIYIDPNDEVTWGGRQESVRLVNVFDANGHFDRSVVEEFVFGGVSLSFEQIMSRFGDDRTDTPDDLTWTLGPIVGADLKGGNDTADLGDQDDVVSGGAGNDTLKGNEGFDELMGDAGNDKLYGGIDRDRLVGGTGNDLLEGGRASDVYFFERGFGKDNVYDRATTVETVREQRVRIYTYGGGEGDSYSVSQTYYEDVDVNVKIDAGANDVIEFGEGITLDDLAFDYVASSDILYVGISTTQAAGTLVQNYRDRIAIRNWNAQVNGEYSDRIETIRFADGLEVNISEISTAKKFGTKDANGLLNLGNGVDRYFLPTGGGIATVAEGDGYKTSQGNNARRVYGHNGSNDILIGGTGSDFLHGQGGNDTLAGGAGQDYLNGAWGDDLLLGSYGTGAIDVLIGHAGADTYRLLEGQSASIYETAKNTSAYLTDIDRIELPDIARWDQLSFTASASHLYIDTLDEAGAKTADLNLYYHVTGMHTNNHDYTVEEIEIADSKTISIADVVRITGAVDATAAGAAAHRSVAGDKLFIGDAADQRIYTRGGGYDSDVVFGDGGNDYIFTYSGDDVLVGGDGNDTLRPHYGRDTAYGGAGEDIVEYFADDGNGIIVNLINGTGVGGIADGDVLDGIERIYSTQANDRLIGDSANNYFIGRRGEDVLIGNAGNDVLRGDSNSNDTGFSDRLIGGIGNDVLQGNKGGDRYEFAVGDGLDTIQDYGDAGTSVVDTVAFTELRDLSALTFSDGGSDNLRINYGDGDRVTVVDGQLANSTHAVEAIETADGRSFSFEAVRLYAASASWQNGSGASELIAGDAGANRINGQGGDDLIFGGAGADHLTGSTGNDVQVGGDGSDTLDTTSGTDLLIGGTGADTYRIGGSAGRAIIEENGRAGESDRLTILSGATATTLTLGLSDNGQDLTLSNGSRDFGTIRDQFTDEGRVEEVQFGSGAALDLARASAALASYMAQENTDRGSVSALLTHADENNIQSPLLASS